MTGEIKKKLRNRKSQSKTEKYHQEKENGNSRNRRIERERRKKGRSRDNCIRKKRESKGRK